jgi:hypothetical protein
LQQHLLNYTHQNVWSPISLLLVPYGLWTVFQSLHFSEESCKCQMIQNQTTSKSIKMEFSMRVSPMWPNAVPHLCGILLVLRHLALVLWMYHITINIHNIRPIDDGSMALMLFIILNNNCSSMNNPFATNIVQWARVCKTLKWIMKVNTEVMYYYQYS